jgi:fluoride exporter
MLVNALAVAAGGAAGSLLRYLMQRYLNTSFPLGTLLVNLSGCLLIGLFWGWLGKSSFSETTRLLLMTGLCGGFTTFSAFSQETIGLMQQGKWPSAFFYCLVSVAGGLLATFAGYKITA